MYAVLLRFILRNGLLQKHVTTTLSEIPKMDPVGELTCYILDRKNVLCLAHYFSNNDFNSSLTLLSYVFLYSLSLLTLLSFSTDTINKGCSINVLHVNLTSCELYRSTALRTSNFLAIRNLRALFHATGLAFCSLRF